MLFWHKFKHFTFAVVHPIQKNMYLCIVLHNNQSFLFFVMHAILSPILFPGFPPHPHMRRPHPVDPREIARRPGRIRQRRALEMQMRRQLELPPHLKSK